VVALCLSVARRAVRSGGPEYVKPVDRRAALIHGEYYNKLRNAAVRTDDLAADRRWVNRTPVQEEVDEAAASLNSPARLAVR